MSQAQEKEIPSFSDMETEADIERDCHSEDEEPVPPVACCGKELKWMNGRGFA